MAPFFSSQSEGRRVAPVDPARPEIAMKPVNIFTI
jgi:hypothetical protein